jgi:hypothetical protein
MATKALLIFFVYSGARSGFPSLKLMVAGTTAIDRHTTMPLILAWIVLAATGYAISVVPALPAYLLIRKVGLGGYLSVYLLAGTVCGVVGALLIFAHNPASDVAFVGIMGGLCGLIAAAIFWAVENLFPSYGGHTTGDRHV